MELNKHKAPTQSDGSMDYDGLIKHIKYLLDASWGSDWGIFSSEGPNVSDPKDIEYPIIVHYLAEMRPGVVGNSTREIKPRYRYLGIHEDPNGTHPKGVKVYGQIFDAEVVFEIWGETNEEANRLAKNFRGIISSFTGFLKGKGLKEILLRKVDSVGSGNSMRDSAKVRRLSYVVRLEELTEIPTEFLRIIDVVEKNLERELKKEKQ